MSQAELVQPEYDRTGTATITDVETDDGENRRIESKGVHYTFVDDSGTMHDGVSYTEYPPTGGTHRVEWVAADPEKSRLVGMRARPYGPATAVILILPAIGLGLVAWQVLSGLGKRRLLRYGVETRGKLVAKSETSIHVNDKPVFELRFEYEVGGRTYQFTVNTTNPSRLVDDEEEPMLYDPRRPEHATTLDHLPGGPKITDDGRIVASPASPFSSSRYRSASSQRSSGPSCRCGDRVHHRDVARTSSCSARHHQRRSSRLRHHLDRRRRVRKPPVSGRPSAGESTSPRARHSRAVPRPPP